MQTQALVKLAVAAAAVVSFSAHANHPVFVEGNCLVPPAGSSAASPGNCGDYDGDGMVGTAEDNDGDRVFGTIAGALGAAGVAQNGRVVIVTSGVFAETVNIAPTTGNVTLEAAPGVEANVDAVLQGDPGNAARQAAPGIIVNAPADRRVTIRNIVSRNWTNGIDVRGSSRVTIEDCRIENNINYGILVSGQARVKIDKCSVTANGFRTGAAGPSAANPGIGIEFEDQSRGAVFRTNVSGNFAAGISGNGNIRVEDVYVFDNHPDFKGVGSGRRGDDDRGR